MESPISRSRAGTVEADRFPRKLYWTLHTPVAVSDTVFLSFAGRAIKTSLLNELFLSRCSRHFTQGEWAAKIIRKLSAEKKRVAV
jgi:hypothetical protein